MATLLGRPLSSRLLVEAPPRLCQRSLSHVGIQRPLRGGVTAAGRSGGGVIDKPSTTLPGVDKATKSTKKRPPIYKVMLHNDSYNKREYVVRVLLQVVDGMTVDDAVVVMQEAHDQGMALVIACSQDEAEQYCETLRLNGLTCTLEPGC